MTLDWKPIETAPKDGRPVWVKGYHFGKEILGTYCLWAFYKDGNWIEASSRTSHLHYLVEWLPNARML